MYSILFFEIIDKYDYTKQFDLSTFPKQRIPDIKKFMKHHLCPFLIPLISMCVVLPMFGAAEPPTCAEHSIAASAVRTPQDVEAFVQCAYEYVLEEGFSGGTQGL